MLEKDRIPKIIHYCWFGDAKLDEKAKKCIASWQRFFPDYEIKQWNETNFNIKDCAYVEEAYACKQWAFVSDYARIWILYHEGGIYFDTDVEVIKDMSSIVTSGPYMGIERFIQNFGVGINPGLGMAAAPCDDILGELLNIYRITSFTDDSKDLNNHTIVIKMSSILKKYGLKDVNQIQKVKGYHIYPIEYFNPLNDEIGKLILTENTYSIHWYSASWMAERDLWNKEFRYRYCKRYGKTLGLIFASMHTAYKEGGFRLLCYRVIKKLIKMSQ